MSSFYSVAVVGGPAAIFKDTLQHLDKSPMFNPLSPDAVIPSLSTGIVPSGLYLSESAKTEQSGGGKYAKTSTEQLRLLCNQKGLSCKDKEGHYLPRKGLIQKLQMGTQRKH